MELLCLHFDSNGGLSQKDMTLDRLKRIGSVPVIADGSEAILAFGQTVIEFLTSSSVKTTVSLARVYGSQFMALLYGVVNHLDKYAPEKCVLDLLGNQNDVLNRFIAIVSCIRGAFAKIKVWEQLNKELGKLDREEIEPILSSIENYDLFKANPYSIMVKSRKIQFPVIDKLASRFSVEYEIRLLNNLKQRLTEAVYEKGHSCYPLDSMIEECRWKAIHTDIRNADYDDILQFVTKRPSMFVIREEMVYLASVYRIESGVVGVVEKIIDDGDVAIATETKVDEFIAEFMSESGIQLNAKQRLAVKSVFIGQRMFIVTGYPGTGKSSIVTCVCFVADRLSKSYLLCAPTGKASMRLGRDAKTIHRLLNLIDLDDEHPTIPPQVSVDIVIVDEVSMVDLHLGYSLLTSCGPNTRLLFLGDANQLPSVRYGNLLADLLESELIGSVQLTKIYRQEDGSSISKVARCVIQGKTPPRHYLKSSDLIYHDCDDDYEIQKHVERLYEKYDGNITILIPTKKGDLGTYNMNNVIHKKIFGEKSAHWMVSEKVICIRNIYERTKEGKIDIDRCVFNGQCGSVTRLKADSLDVGFENGVICVGKRDLEKAYCLTVHKSQGSEYDTVAIVLHKSQGACLYRQLLYTAITRAKKKLYIIGPMEIFERCIRNIGKKRHSLLKERLCELFDCE